LPPTVLLGWSVGVDALARSGYCQWGAGGLGGVLDAVGGFGPGVQGEVEGGPVQGDEEVTADVVVGG
jgi:hypothetical protein